MNRVLDKLVLCVDDKQALGGVVSLDKRMVCARLLNQRYQPSGVVKSWRSSAARTRAGGGERGDGGEDSPRERDREVSEGEGETWDIEMRVGSRRDNDMHSCN